LRAGGDPERLTAPITDPHLPRWCVNRGREVLAMPDRFDRISGQI
jgi:hypothetical protein